MARIALGLSDRFYLGNLDAKRDWGHAEDYVRGMYLILQHDVPDDFVLATGKTTSVREFVRKSFEEVGIYLEFFGNGVDEKGKIDRIDPEIFEERTGSKVGSLKKGQIILEVDPRYFRPTEVDILVGDASKARKLLNWSPKYTLDDMIAEMVKSDVENFKKNRFLTDEGYFVIKSCEEE